VMGPNQDELADMAILIETLGVAIWEVFFLISTGRGVDVQETTAAENEDICEFLTDASCYGFTVRTVEAPFFRRIVAARRGGDARVAVRCTGGSANGSATGSASRQHRCGYERRHQGRQGHHLRGIDR